MKLKVLSVDFEKNLLTFVVPKNVIDNTGWCFGDECEVDISTQIKRGYTQQNNETKELNYYTKKNKTV